MRTLLSIEWGRGSTLLVSVYHRREVTASRRDATPCPPRANTGGSGGQHLRGEGGCGDRHALVRSNLLASRATLAKAPPPAPHPPRRGLRSPPCYAGRLARRRRPALRGALRLVGFAPEGMLVTAPARVRGNLWRLGGELHDHLAKVVA